MKSVLATLGLLLLTGASAAEDPTPTKPLTKEETEFFETNIRPVLVEHCYECHSAKARKVRANLLLDTRVGLLAGGDSGPVIVPGNADKSLLIKAIRWTDADTAMPPKQKLTDAQIARFEQWVTMGAPDPRGVAATATVKAIDIEAGRTWWAFQPVKLQPTPIAANSIWVRSRIDAFVLQSLDAKKLSPSPQADARTLIQRATLDLTGLRPTFEETEAFAANPTEAEYAKLIDRLLDSKHYGERWGRYWLDVVRYGEDNFTNEATTPPYPFAWRYRDWVIDALNRDLPYDRFVSLQLAADLLPNTPRSDLPATGFLGIGPIYHKDGRLSQSVIENLYMDDWDERVDVVSRGFLGLTVACARCHDHKFDPISTKDYYALAGVFASTVATPRPVATVNPAIEQQFMAASQRIFYLSYVANLLRDDPGSKPAEARKKVERFVNELDAIQAELGELKTTQPELHAYLARLDKRPRPYEGEAPPAQRDRGRRASQEPFFHSVYDAGLWVDGRDEDLTKPEIKPGQPRDLPVYTGGNVTKPREPAPRGFPAVISKGESRFRNGSGRRELSQKIFTDAAPLAARVIVNRVWGWHFGKPLVDTPSDFGVQGEKPSHPQLLDDLAARFIGHGWSWKWLHREIMLSATYRQASRPRADAIAIDPANKVLWRMNPRRLDAEAYRDCLLQASGTLDRSIGGPSREVDDPGNTRRTVYGRISRGRTANILQLFGFPEATMHSPGRETATTPLQQLFVMNSPFLRGIASTVTSSVSSIPESERVPALYRKVVMREPTEQELAQANRFLANGTFKEFAHALLASNEVMYWP